MFSVSDRKNNLRIKASCDASYDAEERKLPHFVVVFK